MQALRNNWLLMLALSSLARCDCSRQSRDPGLGDDRILASAESSLSSPSSSSGKVVVFLAAPLNSHIMGHVKVAADLAKLGHRVFVLLPAAIAAQSNIDFSKISLILIEQGADVEKRGPHQLTSDYMQGTSSLMSNFKKISKLMNEYCDSILRNETLIEYLRSIQPDLIVLDTVPFMRLSAVLPYKLHVPFAVFGVAYDVLTSHIPFSAAAQPSLQLPSTDKMTFWQRVANGLLMYLTMLLPYDLFMPQGAVALYASERPFVTNDQLLTSAEIWLIASDHVLDFPKPSMPNVRLTGGTLTGPAEPLSGKFQSFMDEAKVGVIVVSFGSHVADLPKDISDGLFRAFSQLPSKVVFRSKLVSPDPGKILTSTWLPQNDLLGHPNTVLFIGHCGKNGLYEALYHAVPILCAPLFGDQFYNAQCVRAKGFGLIMDLRTVTPEELVSAVTELLSVPDYKRTMSRASLLYRQLFSDPSGETAKWLDHVLQYGGQYMRYAGQEMPAYQFLMLDVWAFVWLVVLMAILVVVCCVRALCTICKRRKMKSE